MTNNQIKLLFTLFCQKYNGMNIKEVPNIRGSVGNFIVDKLDVTIKKYEYVTTFNATKDKQFTIFYYENEYPNILLVDFCDGIQDVKRNIYETKESFLKDFEIPLEDIV